MPVEATLAVAVEASSRSPRPRRGEMNGKALRRRMLKQAEAAAKRRP
jgi:hypothetical protein